MMRSLTLAATLSLLVACSKSHQGSYEVAAAATENVSNVDLLKAGAESLWQERGDTAKLTQALASYEQIVAAEPSNRDAYARLIRGYYFLGDAHYTDEAEKLAAWDRSIKYGKQCLALNGEFTAMLEKGDETEASASRVFTEDDIPCVYWTATSLGKWAKMQGLGTLLKHKDTVSTWMSVVDDKAPDYYYTASTRYWGAYYAALPSFAGQDLDKSKAMFEKAIAANPEFYGNRVLLADYWATRAQDRAVFDEQLNYVVNGDPNSIEGLTPEQEGEIRKAKALLEQADDLFAE